MIDRHEQIEAAGDAVRHLLNQLLEQGYEDQDLSNALFGYALSIMVEHHGRQGVARHLFVTALKFADTDQDPLARKTVKH